MNPATDPVTWARQKLGGLGPAARYAIIVGQTAGAWRRLATGRPVDAASIARYAALMQVNDDMDGAVIGPEAEFPYDAGSDAALYLADRLDPDDDSDRARRYRALAEQVRDHRAAREDEARRGAA